MTAYSRGEVVLVDIAFCGAVGRKRRPAVIVSAQPFNDAGTKLVVAAIAGNVSPPFRPGDTLLGDWGAAGLVKPSAVRGVVATVDRGDIIRRLGRLADADLREVQNAIGRVLGFPSQKSAG